MSLPAHDAPPTDLSRALPRAAAVIEQGRRDGLHIGAQLYVSRHLEVLADAALGEARPGAPMRTDSIMPWLSAGKPLTAVAIGRLWEQDALDLDDPVARHIPEFAANGKEAITIRHLLTHTAGLRWANVRWPKDSWDEIIATICEARPEPRWRPGVTAGYHLATTWFVLGELVRRLDGRMIDRYVRETIFLPLGMTDSWIGIPREQVRAYGERLGVLMNTEDTPAVPQWTDPQRVIEPAPGNNARGPARELGAFYEMLLARGQAGGVRILRPQTVEALTSPNRVGRMDKTFQCVIDWGLGFIVNSRHYTGGAIPYGFGPHAGRRTFGHGGAQSSIGFCDPDNGLVVVAIFNGRPGEQKHQARNEALNRAIYEDLGVAGED